MLARYFLPLSHSLLRCIMRVVFYVEGALAFTTVDVGASFCAPLRRGARLPRLPHDVLSKSHTASETLSLPRRPNLAVARPMRSWGIVANRFSTELEILPIDQGF